MGKKHLQSIIEKLHSELASAESIDEESRELLKKLVKDVEELADDDGTGGAEHATTTGQLQNAAVQFESEHPKLSMALSEVIDALTRLGI